MPEEELEERFGKDGFKQLPDEVYRRSGFTPAKVEVEECHVKVYAGKKTDEIVRAPHPECLLRGSPVSPSLEAAVMNAKYVNAVALYRQEQEFEYLLTEIPKHLDDTDRSFLDDLLPWSPNLPANCRKPGKEEVK